jgi:hypothetical protein
MLQAKQEGNMPIGPQRELYSSVYALRRLRRLSRKLVIF